jgi:hypothetical protein
MNDKRDKGKPKMLEALEKYWGIVTHACRAAGISRQAHYRWLAEDPEYKEACEQMADIALDNVEHELFKQIRDRIPSSTIFYLKTKGKKRGYVEASEQVIYTPEKAPSWLDGSSID